MRKLLLAAALLAAPIVVHAQHQGHDGQDMAGMAMGGSATPVESGQAAFGALTEIVALLEADPRTDWSKVNIDALRDHLVDMDNLTLRARVIATAVPGGTRFEVAGDGPARDSIRRMARSHAAMVGGQAGEHVTVADAPEGVTMTVVSDDPAGARKIRALGFFGIMSGGAHHQQHHLMMARGEIRH